MKNQNKKYVFSHAHFASASLAVRFAPAPRFAGTVPSRLQKLRKYVFYFGFFIAIYFLFFTTITSAQFNLPTIGSIKPTISLTSDTLTPPPNSTITITANLSGVTGVGASNYAWFLNGARQTDASSLNKNIFKLKTGAIGATYKVSVSVATPGLGTLSDTINLTASDVDLTWIANSKAPITYKAKLMPTQNSLVTISAQPFVYRPGTKNLINSNNLIYNWMPDSKIDSLKSGLNKSSYVFRVNNFPGNSQFIRLEIKTEDGAAFLSKDIFIPVAKPKIFLYFSDPSTSLPYGAALKNLEIKPADFSFVAQTYFFNALEKNLKWQWVINNAEVNSGNENPWLATLNLKDKTPGQFSTQIKIIAKNPNNELESDESITNLEIK